MSTWPNRGPPAAPAGGWKKENRTAKTVRPHPSDSSQHASSIAGVVQVSRDDDNDFCITDGGGNVDAAEIKSQGSRAGAALSVWLMMHHQQQFPLSAEWQKNPATP